MPIFLPLWLGSLIMALVLGGVTYVAIRCALVQYRRHYHARHGKAGTSRSLADAEV